jgi:hypothetical protein
MSGKRSHSYRTSNVNPKKTCSEAEVATRGLKDSVAVSLRAVAEPIVQMPAALRSLKDEGRPPEDVKKLLLLGKSIGADFDKFSEERATIDKEFETIVERKPGKKKDFAKLNMDLTMTGLKYIDLNDRIAATLTKSAGDYEEILNKSPEPAHA